MRAASTLLLLICVVAVLTIFSKCAVNIELTGVFWPAVHETDSRTLHVAGDDEAGQAAESTGIVMEGLSAADEAAIQSNKESFTFQAEVSRLMDIIINSLCMAPFHLPLRSIVAY